VFSLVLSVVLWGNAYKDKTLIFIIQNKREEKEKKNKSFPKQNANNLLISK